MSRFFLVAFLFVPWLLAGCQVAPSPPDDSRVQRVAQPVLMGTTCRLIAVGQPAEADAALQAALVRLESLEASLSTYREDSELSRFNAAEAGVEVPLSADCLVVLRAAQTLSDKTGGAFDVTMRPLGQLWAEAAKQDRLPDEAALRQTLAKIGSDKVVVGENSARKTVAGVQVTLDAIAKGYAIHRAAETMREFDLSGGLVEIGGDLECFGRPLDAGSWHVALQSPWDERETLVILKKAERAGDELADRESARDDTWAVCTSGNYRRFVTIQGRRYSHIVDPRTGRPADAWPSVTVVAGDAMTADGWATALSVLGPDEGLPLIAKEPAVEAFFVRGTAASPETRASPEWERFVLCRTDATKKTQGTEGSR